MWQIVEILMLFTMHKNFWTSGCTPAGYPEIYLSGNRHQPKSSRNLMAWRASEQPVADQALSVKNGFRNHVWWRCQVKRQYGFRMQENILPFPLMRYQWWSFQRTRRHRVCGKSVSSWLFLKSCYRLYNSISFHRYMAVQFFTSLGNFLHLVR